MEKTKTEKVQREIERLEREKAKPKRSGYLVYFIIIVSIVCIADELATQIGLQMQNVVASQLFAPIVGEEYAVARMSIVATIAGCTVGIASLYRTLADHFGRKIFLVFNTLGFGIGLFLIGICTNIPVYAAGVIIIQFFIPHDMQQVYIQECAPAKYRATLTNSIGGIASLSVMLIPILRNLFLKGNDLSQWRMVYMVPAVVALAVAIFALFFVRESDAFVESRLRYLRMTDEERKAEKKEHNKQENGVGLIAAIRFCFSHKQIRWAFVAGGFISFAQLVCYNYETILTFGYAKQFLDNGATMEVARTNAIGFVTQALLLFAIGSAIMAFISGVLADHVGRKPAVIAMCATNLAAFLIFFFGANQAWNPYIVGLFCGISVGSYWNGASLITLMCAESCPTNVRVSVAAVQPVVNGMIYMIASTSLAVLSNIMGDTAIGKICFIVSVPGMVLGLILLLVKVKETNGADLCAVRGDEYEKNAQ